MTTQTQADLIADHFTRWANTMSENAQLARHAIQAGDPDGLGIDRLAGRVEAYEDCAKWIVEWSRPLRSDERPVRLVVCS